MSVPSGGGRGAAADDEQEEVEGREAPRLVTAATLTAPLLLLLLAVELENERLFDPESPKALREHGDGDGVAVRIAAVDNGSCFFWGGVKREKEEQG